MHFGPDGAPVFLPEGAAFPAQQGMPMPHEGVAPCCHALSSTPGMGVNNIVRAFAVSGGNVFVGGEFTEAGGQPARRIARWDGSAWHALGNGVDYPVIALAVSGTDLYVGGTFGIARWDGSAWHNLGVGLHGGAVYALAVSGTDLFVGGYFFRAGIPLAMNVARWDGSAWHALGSGVNNRVYSLAVSGTDLFVGGEFTEAGGQPASRIARWDGSAWHALGSGVENTVYALAVSGTDLFVGGWFTYPPSFIARWDGSAWHALGIGVDYPVIALAVSGTDLFVGGYFFRAGIQLAMNVARWDGNAWHKLGNGMNDVVYALAVSGTDLFVGGDFTQAGGQPASYIARWNGTNWFDQLPVQLTSFTALTLNRSAVLQWSTAGEHNNSGFEVQHLRGETWQPLGFVTGQGTTTEQQQYSFTTETLLPGIHAFRLKQVDFDGTATLSPVVEVTVGLNADLQILPPYPNPAQTQSTLHVYASQSEQVEVTVVDMLGRVVARSFQGFLSAGHTERIELNVSALPRGTYVYRVQGETFTRTGTLTVVR